MTTTTRIKRAITRVGLPLLCFGFLIATSAAFSTQLQRQSRTRNALVTANLSSRNNILEEQERIANRPTKEATTKAPVIQDGSASTIQKSVPVMDAMSSTEMGNDDKSAEYQRGLATIVFITFIFASNSPALHAAFSGSDPPPVLLLNAAVSCIALLGLVLGGKTLEENTTLPSSLDTASSENGVAVKGGIELGLWKMMGTTANLYGLAMTTAGHGALLIQLTTLIVPVVQGIQGVPIPRRIQFSVLLALAGVISFTQDSTGSPSATGDALCVLAAIFYAIYDLRLFAWGSRVAPRRLITTKIGTQAILSLALLAALDLPAATEYLSSDPNWSTIVPLVLWSGTMVNALAPFLQVGGQQAVGPTRCQTIYASQPLWAAIMSFSLLGEQIGVQGLVGGSAFLVALFLAATADAPDPNCEEENCEI